MSLLRFGRVAFQGLDDALAGYSKLVGITTTFRVLMDIGTSADPVKGEGTCWLGYTAIGQQSCST